MNNEWKSVVQLFKTKISGEMGGSPLVQNEVITSQAEFLLGENAINVYIKNPIFLAKVLPYKNLLSECVKEVLQAEYEIIFSVQKSQIKTESSDLPIFSEQPIFSSENSLKKSNLRPELNLTNFIRSQSNDLAYAAAFKIAEKPGIQYNPFFVYGNSGLGKTHLINAIGLEILKNFPNYKVLYTPFETFFNDFIDTYSTASKKGAIDKSDFRKKYRNVDVLIIDDIQGISGREGTENEFFNLFNELYRENKQIILSSDVHPNEFKQLPDRIKTRFNQGLVIDIISPDYELRFNLIRRKSTEDRLNLDTEAIEYIVSNINKNVRDLEGAYARVKIFLQTSGLIGSKENVHRALKDLSEFVKIEESLSPNKIIDSVCQHFKIKKEEIKKQDRSRKIAYPRQVCMYLLRKHTDLNYVDIARLLNRKDHTTIIHGVEKIEEEIKSSNGEINEHIATLKDSIFRKN